LQAYQLILAFVVDIMSGFLSSVYSVFTSERAHIVDDKAEALREPFKQWPNDAGVRQVNSTVHGLLSLSIADYRESSMLALSSENPPSWLSKVGSHQVLRELCTGPAQAITRLKIQ
jgi:hypothetical protein